MVPVASVARYPTSTYQRSSKLLAGDRHADEQVWASTVIRAPSPARKVRQHSGARSEPRCIPTCRSYWASLRATTSSVQAERRGVDVALARNTEPLLVQPTRGEKLRACDADPVDEGARAPAHATAGATGEWVEYSPAAQALEGTPGRTGAGWVAVALGQPEAHGELLTRGQTAIGEEAEQLPVERGHVGGDALEATCGAVVRPSGSAVFPC